MIRRDAQLADGSPAWVLISQIEHARVAGELAKDWGAAPVAPLPVRDTLLPAIYRHDDGWRDWEAAPQIDPARGRPRSFLEMPSDVAHEIWVQSIHAVADLGPLAQYVVAQHFIRLRRGGGETTDQDVAAFLQEYDQRSHAWLTQWLSQDANRHTAELAAAAVGYLQMFDAFSLWLCCSGPTQMKRIKTPQNVDVTLTPVVAGGDACQRQTSAAALAGYTIQAEPWPWKASSHRASATAVKIPATPLASDDQLRSRLKSAETIELNWSFVRKE
jgi:hypothetical protein